MLKVALTGGIATGKSYVLAQLDERGVPTIDADELVHLAFASETQTTRAVAEEFGPAVLAPDGTVDRTALAARVFTDPAARLRLEAIIHPIVYEEIRRWFDAVSAPVGVASIPLLYETRREAAFDVVVVTACTADQQLQRTMARGLSEQDARARIAAQIPTEEKLARADYVIWTGGTKADTASQIDALLAVLGGK